MAWWKLRVAIRKNYQCRDISNDEVPLLKTISTCQRILSKIKKKEERLQKRIKYFVGECNAKESFLGISSRLFRSEQLLSNIPFHSESVITHRCANMDLNSKNC